MEVIELDVLESERRHREELGVRGFFVLCLALVLPRGATAEELTFRGELVEVDVEASAVVVKARKSGAWVERTFYVERTTEIRTRVTRDEQKLEEPVPMALSDLEAGDGVVVHYLVIKGRDVARIIERTGAERA